MGKCPGWENVQIERKEKAYRMIKCPDGKVSGWRAP